MLIISTISFSLNFIKILLTKGCLKLRLFGFARVNIVKRDNERLQERLLQLKVKRQEREKQEREITEPPKRELKKDHRLIPGIDAF